MFSPQIFIRLTNLGREANKKFGSSLTLSTHDTMRIPFRVSQSIEMLVRRFIHEIVRLHGVLPNISSARNTRFRL